MKRVAIVHDYLFQFGGAEKVVEKWLEMYPQAELYTSFYVPEKFKTSELIQKAASDGRLKTTWLQWLFTPKFMQRFQKHLFWLYPLVMSCVVVRNQDLVLISTSYCAKNVRYRNCPKIIHYCHSPTRFLHIIKDRDTDMNTVPAILRFFIPLFTFWLKWMDLRAGLYLTKKGAIWCANSTYMQQTLSRIYGIKPQVVYPPVELEKFLSTPKKENRTEPFYLYIGRISFHKKIQLLIQACLNLQRRLYIIGAASYQAELDKLKAMVASAEQQDPDKKGLIKFLGRLDDSEKIEYLSQAKAFLFAGKEDFGITQIEVFASGTPEVLYEAGGALDYLQPGINGVGFEVQSVEAIEAAILKFETTKFDEAKIRATAEKFSDRVFDQAIRPLAGE